MVNRANAMRDAQLLDLLKMQGMWRPSSSSSSATRPYKSIVKEDDDGGTERLIAELVEG